MPITTAIVLLIQYWILWILKTAEKVQFWYLDLILYIIFVIQTIALLWIMFLYINSNSETHLKQRIKDIISTLNNLVIFCSVMIITWNFIIFYFLKN